MPLLPISSLYRSFSPLVLLLSFSGPSHGPNKRTDPEPPHEPLQLSEALQLPRQLITNQFSAQGNDYFLPPGAKAMNLDVLGRPQAVGSVGCFEPGCDPTTKQPEKASFDKPLSRFPRWDSTHILLSVVPHQTNQWRDL